MSPELQALLARIHGTPHLMTLDFAGAGAQALFWLHSVGGSSRTILEATDRYSPASLSEATGFMPERFTAPEVAEALANHAYRRARKLAPHHPVFGVGVTATIATDRTKRGAHRCLIAVRDPLGLSRYELTLDKGARQRAAEEELVSLLIIRAIAAASGLLFPPKLPLLPSETLLERFEATGELRALEAGDSQWLTLYPDGTLTANEPPTGKALLSGSFNPLHDGHRELARVASEHLGQPVIFELPLINADKATIDLQEARRRATQFLGFAPLILSRAPRFSDKAKVFPGATFVLGADTASRLVESRFYGATDKDTLAALQSLAEANNRFLVAARSSKETFQTLEDINIPSQYRHLFHALPEAAFAMDISSTEIRQKNGQS